MSALSPAGRPAPSARPGRAEAAALVGLTAIALGLRVTSISRGLFTDEAYSLALAQRGFGHMLGLFGYEPNGMPYPIVLWPVIRLFGEAEAVLRLPALLAGTAAVPALWWAVRSYAPSPAPLLAAGLLALNPMATFYSQTARPYAFVVLAACLAFGTLGRALEDGASRRAWVAYVASMALLGYSEIFAAPLLVPAHGLIAWRSGRRGLRRWLLSLVALALSCVPLLVAAVIARGRRDALYWLPKPDRELIVLTVQEFTAGFSEVTALRWATLAGATPLVAAALWRLWARSERARREAFEIAACWGILPILLLLAVSLAKPLFYPRYVILAVPGLCMLLAVAASTLRSSRRGLLGASGCTVLVAVAALAADIKQRSALQEDWAPAAAVLKAQRAPGQPTIIDNALVLPTLGYYYPAFRSPGGELVVQEWRDRPLPAGFVGFKDRTGYGSVPNGPPTVREFEQLARSGRGTVWMIVSEVVTELQGNPREGAAVAWARAHCQIQIHMSVGVWLMRASGCPTGAVTTARPVRVG